MLKQGYTPLRAFRFGDNIRVEFVEWTTNNLVGRTYSYVFLHEEMLKGYDAETFLQIGYSYAQNNANLMTSMYFGSLMYSPSENKVYMLSPETLAEILASNDRPPIEHTVKPLVNLSDFLIETVENIGDTAKITILQNELTSTHYFTTEDEFLKWIKQVNKDNVLIGAYDFERNWWVGSDSDFTMLFNREVGGVFTLRTTVRGESVIVSSYIPKNRIDSILSRSIKVFGEDHIHEIKLK